MLIGTGEKQVISQPPQMAGRAQPQSRKNTGREDCRTKDESLDPMGLGHRAAKSGAGCRVDLAMRKGHGVGSSVAEGCRCTAGLV